MYACALNVLAFVMLCPKVSKLNINIRKHPKGLLSLKLERHQITLQFTAEKGAEIPQSNWLGESCMFVQRNNQCLPTFVAKSWMFR